MAGFPVFLGDPQWNVDLLLTLSPVLQYLKEFYVHISIQARLTSTTARGEESWALYGNHQSIANLHLSVPGRPLISPKCLGRSLCCVSRLFEVELSHHRHILALTTLLKV